MESFDIAKAGWLHRQSSILHRWKRNWFVLRTNGDLLYFENPDEPRAEERIVVRARVQRIKPGFECNSVTPPEGMSKGCLFALDMRNEELRLCAESSDDMKAWQIALEEARVMGQRSSSVPPSYQTLVTNSSYGYPGQVLYNGVPGQTTHVMYNGALGQTVYQPGTVIQGPNGTTTTVVSNPGPNVVYVDDYHRRHRYNGSDMAMGVVAGAALGSMMYGPMFWW
ncbi:pleckstrin homology domain-containing family B member 2-like [Haliotis rufescens]|uniref:pleckstrin homology domain-containing family B member 2-like n=1 Tax=Haliotis rufescens TaxID=6454 RepID=UPI001EB0A562|nr:pleckstrin homology domain-containing family B member 2-like [Haliotis rufescens]